MNKLPTLTKAFVLLLSVLFFGTSGVTLAQTGKPEMHYVVSMDQPATHIYHMELNASGFIKDTLTFKLPNWMPGYYGFMEYYKNLDNISARDKKGKNIPMNKINNNTWVITGINNKQFTVSYDIKPSRQFVCNSFLDSTHAYIIPENNFLYIDGFLNTPVSVKVMKYKNWSTIATGLDKVAGSADEFTAPDFDILYDCPILIGNLEELPSFKINGIEHRFIGYKMGTFDKVMFIENLKKVVEAAVAIFGDIPYKQYTFLGIGPGNGGIEHLNNTTLSFSGNGIKTKSDLKGSMNFIGHEYFHHYNVKRIRPFELGPFDYDKGNRTSQLWVSEGLSVYYEYVIVRRAGVTDVDGFLGGFAGNITSVENNEGRLYQSLSQSSYSSWDQGPFGSRGKSISYYDKGPVVGLLLDFAIRNATQNKKSLDDVMHFMYWQYYKKLQRGFTDAEFQVACEVIAGIPLTEVFEYVYTTKELDYTKYLGYAGLKLDRQEVIGTNQKKTIKCVLVRTENPDALQTAIFNSWSK